MSQVRNRARYGWYIFAGCCILSFFITGLVLNTVGLIFSYISADLSFSMTEVSLVITCSNAAMAAGMPVAGKAIEKYNIRIVLSVCVLFCGGCIMLNAVSHHIVSFVVLWICIGFTVPFLMGLTIPVLLGYWFARKTGMVMGLTSAIGGIGGAFFNVVVNHVIQSCGWRVTFVFSGILILLALLPFTLAIVKLKPDAEIPYGSDGDVPEPPETEKKSTGGIYRPLRSPAFALILSAYIMAAMIAGFHQLIPSHVISLGYAIPTGGFVMSGVLLGLAAGNFLMGLLTDRLGPARSISIGCLLGAAGWVGLIVSPSQSLLFAGGLLIGFGQSVTQVGLPCAIRLIFGNQQYATMYGRIAGIGGLACASMAVIGGASFDRIGSYKPILVILAVLYLLSASGAVSAISLTRKNLKKEKREMV